MAMLRATCAALAAAGAAALTVSDTLDLSKGAAVLTVSDTLDLSEHLWRPNLPRTVLLATPGDGCGAKVPGYLVTGQALVWSDHKEGHAKDVTTCSKRCDATQSCVAFTFRKPHHGGQLQCNLYKGLVDKKDSRAKSYVKCVGGVSCPHDDGLKGFAFWSASGTFKSGAVDVNVTSQGRCADACMKDKACMAFTYRKNKDHKTGCHVFPFESNGKGPQRDTHSVTYSKCTTKSGKGPTPEVFERIKKAIAKATTPEEVIRLEQALKSGVLPADLK